ncbi:carboxypeptidase-like regulatory domain-containing protein [Winogradskyella sp.]|jgi:hypothetical protein|uniref:carboxypeptidase-like regulatory domain-containing protein n=1 Tax=Winogradskyella sp. TaxID=1883156 RepID=UPI0025CE26B7|nr:carboxypeptidase-like regulatory domain-containing protein [Winogradskyella sp.]MCT4628601.1 carboxypeptidase-like regulatory domain-containing protein [Winogradskyella sp.]
MNHPFNLDINKPCSENFNNFKLTKKGGFCDSCKKEVIDFTRMNSEEITTYFKTKASANTCGRFKEQQLNTSYNLNSVKKKHIGFITGLGFLILSFFSIFSAQAQDIKKSKKQLNDNSNIEELKEKTKVTVKGTVITKEDRLPLPGASIVLQGTNISVQTDFDGYFKFPKKLKKGDILIVSYVGLKSQKIIIENKKSALNIELEVNMEFDSCVILGKVAVKEIFKSQKN